MGISSHVLDFDDTHSRNIIHPRRTSHFPPFLALSEHRPVSGSDFVTALVLGRGRRIAGSATPSILRITIPAGTLRAPREYLGRPRLSGKLLGLSERQMLWAFGLAATQPVGPAGNVRHHDQELPSRARRRERF